MEPIAVLLSALSLAGTALQPVSDQAVKDGYAGLKELLERHDVNEYAASVKVYAVKPR